MAEQNSNLGKLISVHGIAPAYLQRAVIVAVLSFLFFLGMMLGFYVRQNIGYFLLATAFLLVYIFTMFGWVMMRKNILKIYDKGLTYRKFSARWSEIKTFESIEKDAKIKCDIIKKNGEKIVLSETIHDVKNVIETIRRKIVRNKNESEE